MKIFIRFLLTFPAVSYALTCPVDDLLPYTWGNPGAGKFIQVDANQAQMTKEKVKFTGDVIAKQGQDVFHANQVHYDRQTQQLKSPEPIIYGTPNFAIRAETADYSLASTIGHFTALDYYLAEQKAMGSAATVQVDRKKNTETLNEASYSTCSRLNPDWLIKAKSIYLDHNSGVGKAWHTRFHLGKTPIFYLPYFSFPLNDERKTGFLTPSANLSEGRGIDITQPFYLNIAPNHDATLLPRVMSKRGLMLGAEYRYLLDNMSGSLAGYLLPNDFNTDEKRWSFKSTYHARPRQDFSVDASYQRVSDKHYIKDFEDTLDLSNLSFLESHLTATYLPSKNYRLIGQLKDYQVVHANYQKSDKPYSVLPRLIGQGEWRYDNGLSLNSITELTNFDKDDSISGLRFDQELALSYLHENAYAFAKPRLAYRLTGYQLRNLKANQPNKITRALPTFSLDSGLFFDRQTDWFGHRTTQTLEPRLFYLYTPYRDQSTIPDFDTARISSSYDAMFLTNRFNGKDRIGDANQLTTAISTKFIDNNSGKELAKLSVGQVQYFKDRRVSLNESIANHSRSNIIAEGAVALNDHLSARGLLHQDINQRHTQKSSLGITYKKASDKAFSLSHLYDRQTYEQLDFAGTWRIDDHWRTFWRWNYSLAHSKTIDMIAGLEYADCCWGIRVLARQQRNSLLNDSKIDSSIYLEVALKGLGNLGSDTNRLLSNIIPYYRPINYEGK